MPPDPTPTTGPPPDAHRTFCDSTGRVLARCALWWKSPVQIEGQSAGLIGEYAAECATAGVALLQQAGDEVRAHGCVRLIGPMDGTTAGRYRFVTGGRNDPPFFLEPHHPREWPGHFVDAGFMPLAQYESTVVDLADSIGQEGGRLEWRTRHAGWKIRPLALDRMEESMRAIHRISQAAFDRAFLFRPVSYEEFAAAQAPVLPLLIPELVLLAERAGQAVGFLFAIPDVLELQRSASISTVIIKTVAVLPGRDQAGLGVCLVHHLHETAKSLGYRRVIHALMHESNGSRNIHRHAAVPMRQYTLFSMTL